MSHQSEILGLTANLSQQEAEKMTKPKSDDDTLEFPFVGRVKGWSRLERTSITTMLILISALFIGATGVWAANHVGDPLVKSKIEQDQLLTAAEVKLRESLVAEIQLASAIQRKDADMQRQDAERNREALRNVAVALQVNHDDNLRTQALLTDLRDELRRSRGN